MENRKHNHEAAENIEFCFQLNVRASYNPVSGKVTVLSCTPVEESEQVSKQVPSARFRHELTRTQKNYFILTLGAKFAKAYHFPKAADITVQVNGIPYPSPVRTHKTVSGRIDGLSGLYQTPEFADTLSQDAVFVTYSEEERVLEIWGNDGGTS